LKTPRTAKSIHHYYTFYKKELTKEKVQTPFATTLELSAKVTVLQYQNRGLLRAIDLQKRIREVCG
jgi:hypothetical protein